MPTPTRLLIMRHAEKTGDKDDMHLSEAGRARAQKLASYIPQTFGRPDFLIAAMQSKHSNRSYETLVPLSAAIGVPIDTRFKDDREDQLVAALLSELQFAGRYGAICWHHNSLPGLIAALGAAPGTFPSPWPPDAFNLVVELTFAGGRGPAIKTITEDF